jgi:hypothetical protein
MSKLNLDDVLFMYFGNAESFDMAETSEESEMFLERATPFPEPVAREGPAVDASL